MEQKHLTLYAELTPASVGKAGDLVRLRLWGRLPEKLHIYSIEPQGEFAPPPTQLILFSDKLLAESVLIESDPLIIEDKAFDMSLKIHKNNFWLERTFRYRGGFQSGTYSLQGVLSYQVCDNLICSLPLEKAFNIPLIIND